MSLSIWISGIVTGSLYALSGLGLVITYRSARVVNFALGGVGGFAAYLALGLLNGGLPYVVVFIAAMAIGVAVGAMTILVVRPLARQSPITVGVGTLGVLLVLQAVSGWIWGYSPRAVPVPFGAKTQVHIGGVAVNAAEILVVCCAIVALVVVQLLLRRTRLGLAMRAASSGPLTSRLLGVKVERVSVVAWMLGGLCGALAGVLFAPLNSLAPTSFTTFLFGAFAALVLGGFTSIRGVIVGGIVLGIVLNLLQYYLTPDLINTYTFIVVGILLLIRPHGLFGAREEDVSEPRLPTRRPVWTRRIGLRATGRAGWSAAPVNAAGTTLQAKIAKAVIPLVIVVILPFVLPGALVNLLPAAVATYIAVLGLSVLSGTAGQISIGHGGFMAFGAYIAAILTNHAGVPILLSLPIAFVAGILAGIVVGLPASRLAGLYLALLTLLFAQFVPEVASYFTGVTGGASGSPYQLPLSFFSSTDQYWLGFGCAAVLTALTLWMLHGRLGREWRAVRDSELGAEALGLNRARIKVMAFAWSAGLAALGGALYSAFSGFVTPTTFSVFLSVYLLLAVVIGGSGSIIGAMLGAAFITIVPYYTAQTFVPSDVVFGVALVVVLIALPGGLVGLGPWFSRLVGLRRRRPGAEEDEIIEVVREPIPEAEAITANPGLPAGEGLLIENLTVTYNSLPALTEVSLTVAPGEAVALLGSNGAGKSTLLRAISGLLAPAAGSITLDQTDISGWSADRVAWAGIAHVPEGRAVFPELTVDENLKMGEFAYRRLVRGGSPSRRGYDRDAVFSLFPRLHERLGQRAGTLSGGEQQMVAVGRALLARPRLMMLDEPSLGLAPNLSQDLFERLAQIREFGLSLLIIEQNARLALSVADRAYVLLTGRIVQSGDAATLAADEQLVLSYLGSATPGSSATEHTESAR